MEKMLFICAFWSVEVGYDILRLLSIHEHDHLAILSLDSFLNISEVFTCKPSWQRSWYTFTLKKSLFLCGSNPVPTEVYGIKLNNISRINHKPRETSFRGLKKLVTGLHWKAKTNAQERWASKSLLHTPMAVDLPVQSYCSHCIRWMK